MPALDEEAAIGAVINLIPFPELQDMDVETKVLVVDGHSTDRTREVAEAQGARVVVQNDRGKGGALRLGFDASESDMVLVLDADGSYPATRIPDFVKVLSDGADVVIGSRFAGTIEPRAMTHLNFVGNKLLSLLASVVYTIPITDVCSGMWGIRAPALQRMRLRSQGFDIEAELFAEARRLGLRVQEIPITYSRRRGLSKLVPFTAGIDIAYRLLSARIAASKRAQNSGL